VRALLSRHARPSLRRRSSRLCRLHGPLGAYLAKSTKKLSWALRTLKRNSLLTTSFGCAPTGPSTTLKSPNNSFRLAVAASLHVCSILRVLKVKLMFCPKSSPKISPSRLFGVTHNTHQSFSTSLPMVDAERSEQTSDTLVVSRLLREESGSTTRHVWHFGEYV
jgi:hypothetical protein